MAVHLQCTAVDPRGCEVEVSKLVNAGLIRAQRYWNWTGPDTGMPVRDWRSSRPAKMPMPDYLLLGIRHLLMICQHHKVSLTPPPAVYGRALSTISSMDVQGVSPPPASTFRHSSSLSGTGAIRYRTGSPYFGIGLAPASALLFIPVPE